MNTGRFLIFDRQVPGNSPLAADLRAHGCTVEETADLGSFMRRIDLSVCDVALLCAEGDILGDEQEQQQWSAFARVRGNSPVMIIGVQRQIDTRSIDELAAFGFDDVLATPSHRGQLAAQIRSIGRLALMRRELVRRQETLHQFVEIIEDSDIDLEFDHESLFRFTAQPRVLLLDLDDHHGAAKYATGGQRLPFDCRYVVDTDKAHQTLFTDQIDVTIVNSGEHLEEVLSFVAGMRHSASLYNHPVLVLAPEEARSAAGAMFSGGVHDFVAGPVVATEIETRTHALLRHEKLRQTLARECETSRESIVRDGLTGLYSWGFGMTHLMRLNDQLCQMGRDVSVALCRIDNIKQVNNSFGHVAGDAVIRNAAQIIRRCLRGEDLAVRYTGASYLLIFPETSIENARIAVNRLDALLRYTMYELPGQEDSIQATVSCRLADWRAGTSLEALVNQLRFDLPRAA